MAQSIHITCGNVVNKDAVECWYCHQALNASNIANPSEPHYIKSKSSESIYPTKPNSNYSNHSDYSATSNPSNYSYHSSYWDFEEIYHIGRTITGIISFIISYIYCIASYGFLLGLGLGWIPSLIVAFIAGFLWPLIVIILVILIIIVIAAVNK